MTIEDVFGFLKCHCKLGYIPRRLCITGCWDWAENGEDMCWECGAHALIEKAYRLLADKDKRC